MGQVSEFWGRRWNLAFSEMIQGTLYRPLARRYGRRVASLAGFLFSGLLHEVAISLPVGAGYGLPTAYFVLHGVLVEIESTLGKRWGDGPARAWTSGFVLVPTPLLFHQLFIQGAVSPLLA